MNREAIWQYGYQEDTVGLQTYVRAFFDIQPLYSLFRNLNAARRAAVTSNSEFLTTLLKPYELNNQSIAISKPPLLTILTNYGSRIAAVGLYVTSLQSGYKPLLPVIDITTGQIFTTDPRGGLAVPIVAGEPRVFLPLSVHRDPAGTEMESWYHTVRIDVNSGLQASPSLSVSPTSPLSPSKGRARRMMSWLGSGKSRPGEL